MTRPRLTQPSSAAYVFSALLLYVNVAVGTTGPTGNTGTIALTWTFEPEAVRFETEGEYTRITLKNGTLPEAEPGKPCLPAVCVYVLLPSGATICGIRAEAPESIVMEDVLICPAQPMRTTNDPPAPFTSPDPAAYSSAEKTPSDVVSVLGTHRWHGRTLAALRLNPIRYLASQRALYLASRIEVQLTYEAPGETTSTLVRPTIRSRSAVRDLVANPRDIDRSEPMGTKGPAGGLQAFAAADDTAVYLLVTSAALAPAFQPLVDRRTTQGKQGKLVTTEWIYANYAGTRPDGGTDNQTKIRNCIIDHYQNHGTTWVCLAGDDTIIPLRYIPYDNPTDMYYACLDGTYDEDGDGVYGEALQDEADLLPEVWIGRIPVRTADHGAAYVNKVIRYETAPPDGFANTMLISSTWDWYMSGWNRPAGYWDHDPVDETECGMRNVYRKMIQPYWQATPLGELFNTFSSWDEYRCGDYKPAYDHMVSALNYGYHHVYLWGHGTAAQGAGLDRMMADAIGNATRPSIFFVMSCSTAAIDWEEPSLSEAMIRCPHGGGVGYIGASRTETANYSTAELFYTEVFANKRETLGEAFARSKMAYAPLSQQDSVERHYEWVLNLHGDPALLFAPESGGRALQMLSPKGCEMIDVDSDITIRWNASGTGFQEGEVVRLDYSADGGRSWLPVPGAEAQPFDSRLFLWENPGLPPGSQYRTRVVSVSAPSVSSASGRNFTVAPLGILTVRSPLDTPRFWISGTHANQTDYTFTLVPGENVSLTATTKSWGDYSSPLDGYSFTGWLDANGTRLTHSTNLTFVADGNRTVTARYEPAGALRDYYVNDEIAENGFAPGDNDGHDGMTQATPVRHIQQIIDRYDNIATIHVSAGIYVENIVVSASDSGLTLEGAGADLTVIDGNQSGSCLKANDAGVFTIRGLAFRNGKAQFGGAIFCGNCSMTIKNCIISGNTADYGGAMRIPSSQGVVDLIDNVFENNAAVYGGAIEGGSITSITMTSNRFQGNRADDQGGAIILTGSGACQLTKNVFMGNTASGHGGGVYLRSFGSLSMKESEFHANTAGGQGGGAAVEDCDSVEVAANTFISNTTRGNGGGASVWNAPNGSLTLTGNTFRSNVADSLGGALVISGIGRTTATRNDLFDNCAKTDGGGIYLWSSTATIRDNFICVNSGSPGAGISVRNQSRATISHNTIVGNTAGNVGGGVYCENSSPAINNCILWGNKPIQIHLSVAAPAVSFCDVQGGWLTSRTNTGNISVDPLFVDPVGPDGDPTTWRDNDYHIRANSPCRDAGDPAFVPAANETDLDGQPRIRNGRVDIGADEYDAP